MASRKRKDTFLYRILAENKASKAIRSAKTEFAGLRHATFETFGSFSFGVDLARQLAGAVESLGRAMAVPIKLAQEQERVQAQLNAALRSTQHAAGLTSAELRDMASELQRVTAFGDETTIAAQALLLTFTNISGTNGIFQRTIQTSQDLATAMGQELNQSVLKLGKALNDPIRGVSELREVGISFTDTQTEVIRQLVEQNRLFEAQSLVLDELDRQFGGSAETMRNTFGGAVQAASNAWGGFLEQIGFLVTNNPVVLEALATVTWALEDMAASVRDGEGSWAGVRGVVNDFVSSVVPLLLRGLATVIDALGGTGGLYVWLLRVVQGFQFIGLTVNRISRTFAALGQSVAALNAYLDDDWEKVFKITREFARQEKQLDAAKEAYAQLGAQIEAAGHQTTEAGDLLRAFAVQLEDTAARIKDLRDSGIDVAALRSEFVQLEAEVLSVGRSLGPKVLQDFERTTQGMRMAVEEAWAVSTTVGYAATIAAIDELDAMLQSAGKTLRDVRQSSVGSAAPFTPPDGVELEEEQQRDPLSITGAAGDRISGGLSAAIESAAGGFQTLEEAGLRWTQGLRAEATRALLDPILGAESAMSDLFDAAFSPLRAIGEAIEDNLIRPLIDGFLEFIGVKAATEKAAAVESAAVQKAAAAETVVTQKAAVLAMMPGLSAAATAALIATFGGAGAAAAALPGLLATGAAAGVAAASFSSGGRISSPTLAWLGEAADEWVIPTSNPGAARSLLDQMMTANPQLLGGRASRAPSASGGRPIQVNVTQASASPKQTGLEVARRLDQILGRFGA